MDRKKFEEYIKTRYEPEIDWYHRKARSNQILYQVFQWATIILGSTTPVLIVEGGRWVKWAAVGLAVLVAISNAALKAFKYQEDWINYRRTSELLRKEIHFYEAGVQGYGTVSDKESLFVERVESLISRENTVWVIAHEKHEDSQKK